MLLILKECGVCCWQALVSREAPFLKQFGGGRWLFFSQTETNACLGVNYSCQIEVRAWEYLRKRAGRVVKWEIELKSFSQI